MALPLEILADLQLTVDGESIDVQADGRYVVVNLPSLRAGRRLLDAEPLSRDGRGPRQIREVLEVAGITLEIQLEGAPIAVLGAEAAPGRLSRALRLDGVELRPVSTLRQTLRRRPVVTALVAGGLAVALGWAIARIVRS